MKILLDKKRSVTSNNKELKLNLDINSKNKLLPGESLSDKFSLFEQYNKERDECNRYRLIFNINSVCSNILYNVKTEVVINEGSDSCECLNFSSHGWDKQIYAPNAINTVTPITINDAIRNCEYSHPDNGNFTYHCGIDIFNNHMLRKNRFIHVNPVDNNGDKSVYNTIADYLRYFDGKVVKDSLKAGLDSNNDNDRHLYFSDSLDSVKEAYFKKCQEKDGWWGFVNPGMINLPTSSGASINDMISNRNSCEFINFYPDKSLFSFVPKYNGYKKRIEKNWECCITYPFLKDVEMLKKICGTENDSIPVKFKIVTNSAGIKLLQCTSYFKHNLNLKDNINLYYYIGKEDGATPVIPPIRDIENSDDNAEEVIINRAGLESLSNESSSFQLFDEEVRVYSLGDLNGNHKDRIFSIRYDDIENIYDEIVQSGLFYKKVSYGSECEYYVRKFKKVKNQNNTDLNYDINKTGFGLNIYGDDEAQLIFIDDLDLSELKDENDRDIQEVFLTFIKTNKGHDLWYQNHITNGDDVEYSHCFGKLTSGIDFAGVDVNEQPFNYNVRYLHNLDKKGYSGTSAGNEAKLEILNTFSAWSGTILQGVPEVIEDDITIDNDEFYGDIVEFDRYLYKTTVIGNVYHRFNTAQREIFDLGGVFKDTFQDLIVTDDFDSSNNTGIVDGDSFRVKTFYLNSVYDPFYEYPDRAGDDKTLVYSNIMPEGYFYNPHNQIRIKEETDVMHSIAKSINYAWFSIKGNYVISTYQRTENGDILIGKKYIDDTLDVTTGNETINEIANQVVNRDNITPPTPVSTYSIIELDGYTLKVKAPVNFGFIKGDNVCVYDKETNQTIWGTIKSFKDMILTIIFNHDAFNADVLTKTYYFKPRHLDRKFYVFWSENNVPIYAKLCLEKQEFSWRNLKNQSDLYTNSELYDLPFSNGRLYIEKNINFFLKRQDPRGDYKLSKPLNYKEPHPLSQYIIPGAEEVNISRFETFINDGITECY